MPAEKPTPTKEPVQERSDIVQLAEAILARNPRNQFELNGLSEEAQQRLTSTPKPKKYRIIPGKSIDTGATFDLQVVESNVHKNGRVTALLNYTHPEGMFKSVSAGGRCPDGFPVLKDSTQGVPEDSEKIPRSMLSMKYLQWRWTEFWQTDLRRFVGREIQSHMCVDENAIRAVQWREGRVSGHVEDEAAV